MFSALSTVCRQTLSQSFHVQDIDITWQQPQSDAHGDTCTPIALQQAKAIGKNPRDIAQVLADALQNSVDVERVEVAGAGYVNVWLTTEALLRELEQTRAYCSLQPSKGHAPVIVEYSQPNIAKPLGAHHLLSTLIGQSLANLYQHMGYEVIRWNYLGDWGTQFGKLAVAVEKWGDGRPANNYSINELLDLYVRFHNEAEGDDTLEHLARETFAKLEAGDKNLRAFWQDVVATTKQSLGVIYKRLHVEFDLDLGESFYEEKMEIILTEGIEKSVFTEGEGGALIVTFDEQTGMPPYLVRKGDGATLYSTRDIAQMRYRIDTYQPHSILIVTDVAQQLHFQQLEATCTKLDWELPHFENIIVGRMRFADASMSTRKGNVLRLSELLDEAVDRAKRVIASHGESIQADDTTELAEMMGIGAVAYAILSQNRKQGVVFDWDTMLSFDGNSAPYLQYTHARVRSLLRKAESTIDSIDVEVELQQEDRSLITTLLLFPSVLHEALSNHMPHTIANFLFSLCQKFNTFYNNLPILKASKSVRALRLYLTQLTADVLEAGAQILTLRLPQSM